MFLATLETRHFTFTALDTTAAKATAALRKGWATHAKQYRASRDYCGSPLFAWSELADDVSVQELTPGTPYRDGSPLTPDGGAR